LVKYNPPPEGDTRLKLAVKDNMDVKGEVTSAGSEYLAKHNPPAEKDAPCLARARADKNVFFIGRTNMTELAVAPSGVNEYYGTPRNRRSHTRKLIPGGSSSGAAVVVANGIADVAFGTDTAGSVRVPAACCGVFGLKTTFGLVPIKGIYPISDKYLDTVGPLAKDIPRLVKGMDLLEAGFVDKYQAAESSKPTGETIRVGRLYVPGTDSAIDKAVDEALELAKFKVVRLNDDFVKKWVRAQKEGNTVAAADAWQHDRDLASKSDVNIVTKAIIALGNLEYSLNYKGALKYRLEWQRTLRDLFKQVDFIALPTLKDRAPSLPFFGGSSALFEKKVLDMQNTVPANLAGNPAIAVPIHLERERGRITSLELVGPLLSEAGLVNAARIVEDAN
jgi:Asp-tRNA(Asn)/Glu-tRNA(Gln) amidotransferase A subunit family amidase